MRYLRGEGVDRDAEKARSLFRWSCDRGLKTACDNLKSSKSDP
jgi:hypothetical protein